jgi:beta-glucosidase
MKRSRILFLFIFLQQVVFAQVNTNVNIDALIAKMTVEEKVGQMSQIDLGVVAEGGICNLKNPQTIDTAKLRIAIEKYKIGSMLNVGCGSGTISLDRWHEILNTIHTTNTKLSRLNIPILYGIDAIHGVTYTKNGTLFPQQIAQAATWNPELVRQAHEVTAYETRASGIPWNFSPVLDLGRQPLWSRFFETFGEDVFLAKAMTRAAIKGLQGNSINNPYKVSACMKHFLGYSMPLSGKDRTPAWIGDRELREYFLPTFEAAIANGARTIMINSGDINGTPVHANYDILTKLLRDELRFTGVAITDWEDIYKLVNLHRVAPNKKEAVKMAILAGIDMSMTPNDFEFNDALIALINEKQIPMARIDASVKRILQLKKDLGLFTTTIHDKKMYPKFGSAEHAKLSYNTACESITLLKNKNNILPLNKTDKIFICGPGASSLNIMNGGWTHTWQGIDTSTNTIGKQTILQAIQNKNNATTFSQGATLDTVIDLNNCIANAKEADKIIVCIGEQPCTEMPGNIDDLSLPKAQKLLVAELAKLGKPIVLVCCFNRPRIINEEVKIADAILYAYLPSNEGGLAIADILYGEVNPSGKLPFTYPNAVHNIVHYDHKSTEDLDVDFSMNAYRPEFDFGYGLSYTNFAYSNLKVSSFNKTNSTIEVSVQVSNTGKTKGREVVQLYYKDMVASIAPAVKKLCAFQKIELKPNETRTINFIVEKKDFSFINKNLQRVTEPGDFELQIANLRSMINIQ